MLLITEYVPPLLVLIITGLCVQLPLQMKSTLKVHNPRVIILLICVNDVQGKELSF